MQILFRSVFPLESSELQEKAIESLPKLKSKSLIISELRLLLGVTDSEENPMTKATFVQFLNQPYISEKEGTLNYFQKYVQETAKCETTFFEASPKQPYYSLPAIVIIQTPGSGKTRLMIESGRKAQKYMAHVLMALFEKQQRERGTI